MDYQEYKRNFLEQLRNDSAISGTDTEDEFLNRTLDVLSEFNEVDDPHRTGMGDKRGRSGRLMRVDGYSFDEAEHSLILFICDFQDSFDTDKLTMSRVDELYWRLYFFLDEVCNGNIGDYFDDSDDVLKIASLIRSRMSAEGIDPDRLLKIKFYILTNKDLDTKLLSTNLLETTIRKSKESTRTAKSTKKIKKDNFKDKPLEINLWYLERFYEMENSNINEPIVIDIRKDFPEIGLDGIPCIKGNIGENLGYEAYIAIIPGKLLASIYIDHGSKVLEGNVRAFLGTGGSKSVNSGIRRTINTDPTKFFTYNNGIATTASEVEIEANNGELLITKIVDLQIINGGQTTASLAEAVLKRTNVDLDGIYVPMKLTVIDDREMEDENGVRFYDQMVQNIAKYANSQNKVTAADLFSNDPFHILMEKMSKKYLAPPSLGAIQTGWYYERSRKKYLQELNQCRGERAKKFAAKFPKKQIINKEQLAMYLTAISCKPDVVSRGKNWVMKDFSSIIGEEYRANKAKFNEFYFQKCICAAIIFRSVDNYLEENKDSAKHHTGFWYKTGGYKLNIVPYSIAKIISSIPKGYVIDWRTIWNRQSLTPAFMREIEKVTKITNDFICDSHGVIVTEYCKKAATWEKYRDSVEYTFSDEFIDELITEDLMQEYEKDAIRDRKDTNDLAEVMDIINLGTEYWNKVLNSGLAESMVSYEEQSALKEIIHMVTTGTVPQSRSGKIPRKIMNIVQTAVSVKEKLETEGIIEIK